MTSGSGCFVMAQRHRQTSGHGNSMTDSAQWGRVGENVQNSVLKKYIYLPSFVSFCWPTLA